MKRSQGMGTAGIIVTVVIILLVIFGIVYLVRHNGAGNNASSTATSSRSTSTATTTASAANTQITVAQPPAVQTTVSAAKVPASISIAAGDTAHPLMVKATCTVNTSRPIYGLYFFSGANGAGAVGGIHQSSTPVGKTQTFTYTYPTPGRYDAGCVPDYGDNTPIDTNSPYAADIVVNRSDTVAGQLPSAPQDIDFTFAPTSGLLPQTIDLSCTPHVTDQIIGVFIHRDAFGYAAAGDTSANKFVFATAGVGSGTNVTAPAGTLITSTAWKGTHNVYCTVQFANGHTLSSTPVSVTFK